MMESLQAGQYGRVVRAGKRMVSQGMEKVFGESTETMPFPASPGE